VRLNFPVARIGNSTFCSTVFQGINCSNSWNTIIRSGPGPVIGLPPIVILPLTGSMKPPIAFSRVDLPQPDGPRITYRSLSCTEKLTL
jgi:hypothetical protein